MTETDVQQQEAEILTTPIDPAAEAAWIDATTTEFRGAEQRLMAEWRMWKFLRDDGRMTATAKELARIRECLSYLRGRKSGS